MEAKQRIAVIGAGPIGLEAALYGLQAGYDVQVYERGGIADNMRDWGHVRLFSPFGLNASDWGRASLVAAQKNRQLPGDQELLTGREYVERYLIPLAQLPAFARRIHEQAHVLAVGRTQTWKHELVGLPERLNDRFRLLLRTEAREFITEADIVLDCSGTYSEHNWLGAGGIPCVGEMACMGQTDYGLPDVLGRGRNRFAGKTTLVVGGGYSAATSVVSLATLAAVEPDTRVVWLTRSDRRPPLQRIYNDVLSERDGLAEAANRIAMQTGASITWHPGHLIQRVGRDDHGRFHVETVTLHPTSNHQRHRTSAHEFLVDRIVANVGYRPDRTLYEELQVEESSVTEGPAQLSSLSLRESLADALTRTSSGFETLRTSEPGFFILGAKSYGRDSHFLMKTGLEQIQDLFQGLIHQSAAARGAT